MFARNVSIHLKSNMLSDYSRTFEKTSTIGVDLAGQQ
jgi:hypothetical protein